MGNRQSHSSESSDDPRSANSRRLAENAGQGHEDGGDDPLIEVPPPMQPIASVPLPTANSINTDKVIFD